jgi:putative NADPH-quinone reductase
MKNILLIQSSPRASESYSQRVADSIVNEIKDRNPSTTVTFRDLAEDPLPHVGPAFISALSAKPEELTAEQSDALALSDALIEELQAADIVVLAVPMHNFGISSTLKAWIDHVVRVEGVAMSAIGADKASLPRLPTHGRSARTSSVNLVTPTAKLSCESVTEMERRKGNSHDSQAHISSPHRRPHYENKMPQHRRIRSLCF